MKPHATLADLIPPGMFVGTSLILPRAGRFLFGLRRPRQEGDRHVLELTGIGGRMEPDDASPGAGARREAREETGCDVRLMPCSTTMVVRGPGQTERVALAGDERPAALVFRRRGTRPHEPWDPEGGETFCVPVFAGECLGQPYPAAELPALLWLPAAALLETAQHDVPLGRLLAAGAELVCRDGVRLPGTMPARLSDSQEALVLALGAEAPAFYALRAKG